MKKENILRTVSFILLSAVVTAFMCSCTASGKLLESEEPKIKAYLSDKYGNEMADNVKIKVKDADKEEFEVKSPLLGKDSSGFVVKKVETGTDYYDSFMNLFNVETNFLGEYEKYVEGQFPENYQIEMWDVRTDFNGYSHGDDITSLFDKSDYTLLDVKVNFDELDNDKAFEFIEEFHDNYMPMFDGKYDGTLNVIILCKHQAVATVSFDPNGSSAEIAREPGSVLDSGEFKGENNTTIQFGN